MATLQEIQELVTAGWKTTIEEYPIFSKLNEHEQKAFVRRHSLRHLHKSIGRLEAMEEVVDHTGDLSAIDKDEATEYLGKTLMQVVEYAHQIGLSGKELATWLEEFFAKGE